MSSSSLLSTLTTECIISPLPSIPSGSIFFWPHQLVIHLLVRDAPPGCSEGPVCPPGELHGSRPGSGSAILTQRIILPIYGITQPFPAPHNSPRHIYLRGFNKTVTTQPELPSYQQRCCGKHIDDKSGCFGLASLSISNAT